LVKGDLFRYGASAALFDLDHLPVPQSPEKRRTANLVELDEV
jgi:hypothetical protein